MSRFLIVSTLVVALALTACDKGKPAGGSKSTGPATTPAVLPAGFFLATAPADAKDIKDAKPTLKVGDKIVLVGRIGGSEEPFVAERAVFTMVDSRLKRCGEANPEDSCETPWDYCCEPRESITANSVTVQVVGNEGKPIKAEINGVQGLKPSALVTVVGTVARAEGEAFVVNASGLYVRP